LDRVTRNSRSKNFAYFRDLVVRFFGEGLAFLTGELFSADLNTTFLAGAFGVALAFLAGAAAFLAGGVDLAFLAGDSSLGSVAFLLPRVGFSTGVSTLTGLSAFLVPRVAFLAGAEAFLAGGVGSAFLAGVSSLGSVAFFLPRVGFATGVSTSTGISVFLVPRVAFFTGVVFAFLAGDSSLGSSAFLLPRVVFSAGVSTFTGLSTV